MDLDEREIFKIQAYFLGVSSQQVTAQGFRFFFTVGTFKITEQHNHYRGAGSAEAWLQLSVELIELHLEWILFHVEDIAAQNFLAILGNIERFVGRGLARGSMHLHFFK